MNEIIGIIPHKFRRRGFGVACTLLLRAGLNFLGLAVLLPVLALALVCSGFGFTLQPVAQSGTTADHAALFCALNPFVAATLGAVCFHEHFGLAGLLGGALILAGILASCWPQKTGG